MFVNAYVSHIYIYHIYDSSYKKEFIYITFRLINECDLQLYEGVSFNSQSQTEEQSFEY
jgi:hypothetical protein